jgi:hypothetical protein
MGKHGSDIDGRADLYSAGIVIYEMLTGRLPFESDTPIGILIKHIQTMPPPAHEVRPDLGIPKPISMVLMKVLQKDRNDRFQSAEEMLDALERPEQWAATARIGAESATGRDDATAVFGSDFLANLKVAPARIPTPSHVPSAPPPRTPAPSPPAPAPRVEPQRAPSYPPISPVAPVEPVVAEAPRPARPTSPAPRPAPAPQPRKPAYVPPPAPRRTWLWVLLGVLITAGAMGGGGYWYLRTQAAGVQQPAPTVAAAPAVSDSDIQASVTSALTAYPVLQNVQASTEAGVVTLSGMVGTPAEADLAVKVAGGQRAVKDVRNQINFPAIAPVATQRAATPPVPEKPAVEPRPKPSPKTVAAQEPPTPRGPSAQQRRRIQELLADGERQTNSGAYAAAIESYQSALDIDSNDAAARAGMARAKQAMETEQEILRRRK